MTKISGQAHSFVPKEPLEVQIVESYSAADRNDLAGGEKESQPNRCVSVAVETHGKTRTYCRRPKEGLSCEARQVDG
jgi:hypothetical protein